MRSNAKLTALLVALLFALLMNFAALGANLFWQIRHGGSAPVAIATTNAAPTPDPPAEPSTTTATTPAVAERPMHWHDAPFVFPVGGDDTEDILGQFSTAGDDNRLSYFVGAFDGHTLTRLWRAGPIAVVERSDRTPILQLAVGHLLAAESNAVHLYDAATGDESGTVHTSDRVTDLCVYGAEKSKVWAKVADGKSVTIDPTSGDSKAQETAPQGCQPPKSSKLESPGVSGFSPAKVLVESDVAVALGAKSPGTPVPMAVGFDPKSKKVRWQHAIAESEDPTSVVASAGRITELTDGRLYASFRLQTGGWHFAAIDGKTGDRAWEVPIPDGNASQGSVTVSAVRVYLAHGTWLDIYDKITGHQAGTLGDHRP